MADDSKPAAGAASAATSEARTGQPQLKIDTSHLKSSYCNISTVTSTREELVINFGVNQNWDLGQKEMDVELLHRIILSPLAAVAASPVPAPGRVAVALEAGTRQRARLGQATHRLACVRRDEDVRERALGQSGGAGQPADE